MCIVFVSCCFLEFIYSNSFYVECVGFSLYADSLATPMCVSRILALPVLYPLNLGHFTLPRLLSMSLTSETVGLCLDSPFLLSSLDISSGRKPGESYLFLSSLWDYSSVLPIVNVLIISHILSSFPVVYSGRVILNPVISSWSVEKSLLNLFLLRKMFVKDNYHCLQRAELIFIGGCASAKVNRVAKTEQRHFFEQNFLLKRGWRRTFWVTHSQKWRWHSKIPSTEAASWLMLYGAQDPWGGWKEDASTIVVHLEISRLFWDICLSVSLNCLFLPGKFRPSEATWML